MFHNPKKNDGPWLTRRIASLDIKIPECAKFISSLKIEYHGVTIRCSFREILKAVQL